jgi:hypothetical protein
MDILRYDCLRRRATTINRLNRLHISLENIITPGEMERLYAQITKPGLMLPSAGLERVAGVESQDSRERLSAHSDVNSSPDLYEFSAQWIEKLRWAATLNEKSKTEFGRRKISRKVYRYSSALASKKRLIICFTGNSFRPMMPISFVLNHIDPAQNELVAIRTVRNEGYRTGIVGVADSFADSLDRLPKLLEFERYYEVSILGTSGGALPAILAGLHLKCANILAVGSNAPSDKRWTEFFTGREGKIFYDLLYKRSGRTSAVFHLAYGDRSTRDYEAATELSTLLTNRRVHKITGAPHDCLFPLILAGNLTKFFSATICSPMK